MDFSAVWPIIQRVLVNLLSSLLDGRKQVITIENINALIETEIRVCGNNAILRSFDPVQLQDFLREFLGSVTFLQVRIDEISLRLDRLGDGMARTSLAQTERLRTLEAKLSEIASERIRRRPRAPPNVERAKRPVAEILREVEEKISKG